MVKMLVVVLWVASCYSLMVYREGPGRNLLLFSVFAVLSFLVAAMICGVGTTDNKDQAPEDNPVARHRRHRPND